MNNNKVIKLIENEAKKRELRPYYYRDENNNLWIGQQTAIFCLDSNFVLENNWQERSMENIIPKITEDLMGISLSSLQINDVYLNYKENVVASVFLAKDCYTLVQTRYIDPFEKDKGRWLYKSIKGAAGHLIYVDEFERVKALICSIYKKQSESTKYEEQILQLAAMLGKEEAGTDEP